MLKTTKVSEIMTTNLFTIEITDELRKADEIMKREQIKHVPVVEGTKYIGIITSHRILEYTLRHLYDFNEDEKDFIETRILDFDNIIEKNIHLLYPEDSIMKVIELFTKYKSDVLPVVDWDKNLLGLITTTDIFLFLNKVIQEEVA
jgi:CBS domain-containing protein